MVKAKLRLLLRGGYSVTVVAYYVKRSFMTCSSMIAHFFDATVKVIIGTITKFSILIGSARAYLSRNWRAITWVSNYRYLITTFSNWIPVIGHLRHSRINYMHFNGFLQVFLLFVRLLDHTIDFCTQRRFSKSF